MTDGADPSVIMATLDGDNTPIGMTSMIGAIPVGTRVYVFIVPPAGNFIVGLVTTAPVALNMACASLSLSAGTTTSITFVDMPGPPTLSFTKMTAASRLRVDLTGTFFSATASAGLRAGISFSGASGDFEITGLGNTNTSLGNHVAYAGHVILDPASISGGIPAGTHTVTGRWRRNAGTGTLTLDTADIWHLCITEIP